MPSFLDDALTTYRATRDAYWEASEGLIRSTGPYMTTRAVYIHTVYEYVHSLLEDGSDMNKYKPDLDTDIKGTLHGFNRTLVRDPLNALYKYSKDISKRDGYWHPVLPDFSKCHVLC